MPCLRLHQTDSHCLLCPGDFPRPHLTQFAGPSKRCPVAFLCKQPALIHVSNSPKICQTSSLWPHHAPYLPLCSPRSGISGSWPWFAAWPLLGTSKSRTSSGHLQIACGAHVRRPPSKTQLVVDLGLYFPGGPRASSPSGQLKTTSKHHPTTSTSDTFKGWIQGAPVPHGSKSCSVP